MLWKPFFTALSAVKRAMNRRSLQLITAFGRNQSSSAEFTEQSDGSLHLYRYAQSRRTTRILGTSS